MAKGKLILEVETTGSNNELRDQLNGAVQFLMNRGIITGDSETTITSYEHQVVINGDPNDD